MVQIKQSVILAERTKGIIKQKGVSNSNLTAEVKDYCADSTIKRDTEGVVVFPSNGEEQDGIFIPLSKQKTLIELLHALENLKVSNPVYADLTNPNILALEEIKDNLNSVVAIVKVILKEVI